MAYSADNTPPDTPTAAAVPVAGFGCQEYDFSLSFHSSIISPPDLWNDDFSYDDGDEDLENGYHFPTCNSNNLHIGNESNDDFDYDYDSDLDSNRDLVETEEDENRQDPASRSLIEYIPSVKITEAFIGSISSTLDPPSSCSVCTEEFIFGTEAKRLPCNHIYHDDCIVMWLLRSNSCPLCRSRMVLVPIVDGRRKVRRRIAVAIPFGNFREEVDEFEMT